MAPWFIVQKVVQVRIRMSLWRILKDLVMFYGIRGYFNNVGSHRDREEQGRELKKAKPALGARLVLFDTVCICLHWFNNGSACRSPSIEKLGNPLVHHRENS